MSALIRRTILTGLLGAGSIGARAAEWPEKNVVWVVPFPPGGSADVFARSVAGSVSATLGQTIVVDNRSGAGGTVAAAQVARAPADGYTMLIGYTGLAYAPTVYPQPGFDLMRDFAPISALARTASVLVVNPERLDVSTLPQFVEAARRAPGAIDMASPGLATVQHFAIVLLQNRTGIEVHHVAYRGGPPAMQDLLSGQVAAMFHTVGAVAPYVNAGKLRALAVAGRRREALLPDVPTMEEAGVRDFRGGTWFGLFAPRQTPAAILDRTHAAVQAALDTDEVKRTWAEQGAKVELENRADFNGFVAQEVQRWTAIAKAAGVKME
jgi:tripartite-type tricarboxylate transporter receptor subunit TctC